MMESESREININRHVNYNSMKIIRCRSFCCRHPLCQSVQHTTLVTKEHNKFTDNTYLLQTLPMTTDKHFRVHFFTFLVNIWNQITCFCRVRIVTTINTNFGSVISLSGNDFMTIYSCCLRFWIFHGVLFMLDLRDNQLL